MQQDRLVAGWFCHAAFADFDAVAGRQDDVDAANLREFLQDAAGFVAETGFLAQGGQRFPEHIWLVRKIMSHILLKEFCHTAPKEQAA